MFGWKDNLSQNACKLEWVFQKKTHNEYDLKWKGKYYIRENDPSFKKYII